MALPFVFTSIENGMIVTRWDDVEIFCDKANRKNAQRLGALLTTLLQERGEFDSYYSSSVDFPHEYGAPRINFRRAIHEGAALPNVTLYDPINDGQKP